MLSRAKHHCRNFLEVEAELGKNLNICLSAVTATNFDSLHFAEFADLLLAANSEEKKFTDFEV